MTDKISTNKKGNKPNFARLMSEGGGLSGFSWPENCGDFDIRIAQDGTWFYRDSPIGRLKLVQLFATALQRDEKGQYWLVTPFERGLVQVDDAPFVVIEMQCKTGDQGSELHMRTNLDHWIRVDSEHKLQMRKAKNADEERPYIHIRDGLDALINRSVYYELVELAEFKESTLKIDSAGESFILGTI